MENTIKIYQELTYIETYDDQIKTTTASIDTIQKILKEEQFLRLWDELINKSNIKHVFTKELDDVEKVIYAIDDKRLKEYVKTRIKERTEKWLRVNVNVVQNLITNYQNANTTTEKNS